MVSSRKMRGLIGLDEAQLSCTWQVAKDYLPYANSILPDVEAGGWKQTMYSPLADPNLFLSFSRLGGRGDYLPEALALRWIRKHGLLQLRDSSLDRLSLGNQAPITIDEFREEARRAHEALTLFEAIKARKWDALRPRIGRKPIDASGRSSLEAVYLDGRAIPVMFEADRPLADDAVQVAALNGLEALVEERLREVRLVFDHYSGNPRPTEVYRPRLVVKIPNLRAAIWYQFATLITDAKPMTYCEVCNGPIIRPRSDKKVCSATCRKEKSRRNKMRGESD